MLAFHSKLEENQVGAQCFLIDKAKKSNKARAITKKQDSDSLKLSGRSSDHDEFHDESAVLLIVLISRLAVTN